MYKVSPEDQQWAGEISWYINGCGYPYNRRKGFQHRLIAERMGLDLDGRQVDHINGDPADNRRENLRAVTTSENQQNRRKQVNNTSGYPGVRWHKSTGKWVAQVRAMGKQKHLGSFDCKREAYKVRQKFVEEHYSGYTGRDRD